MVVISKQISIIYNILPNDRPREYVVISKQISIIYNNNKYNSMRVVVISKQISIIYNVCIGYAAKQEVVISKQISIIYNPLLSMVRAPTVVISKQISIIYNNWIATFCCFDSCNPISFYRIVISPIGFIFTLTSSRFASDLMF